jgi:1,4-dihydroxy-2-naphthoate octaprenyltransferase
MSRPAFHTVGVLPFCLGTLLAWRIDHRFQPDVFFLGVFAVILIMLSAYQAGEYFDLKEDTLSRRTSPSRFAGGSGVIPAGRAPRFVPLLTSVTAFLAAGAVGLLLQFHFRTGPYTLLLGVTGALPGFFYSTRPVRLVQTGLGEVFIGFCYGWLPVAAAYYIQTAGLNPLIHWIAAPIALSIVNVILMNEFPDYEADRRTGKRNLLFRVGKPRGRGIFIALTLLSWVGFALSLHAGVPRSALYVYGPVVLAGLVVIGMLLARRDLNRTELEAMCALTIAINLGTTAAYLWAFWK